MKLAVYTVICVLCAVGLSVLAAVVAARVTVNLMLEKLKKRRKPSGPPPEGMA